MLLMAVLRDITNDKDAKDTLNRKIYQRGNEYEEIPERVKIKYRIRERH